MNLVDQLDQLPEGASTASERLLQAFELHEHGVLMQIEKLKRQYPGISEHDLAKRLRSWLAREGED